MGMLGPSPAARMPTYLIKRGESIQRVARGAGYRGTAAAPHESVPRSPLDLRAAPKATRLRSPQSSRSESRR